MENIKLWQQYAVYQIYPRSFKDSNGDGIGDIPGIISKLDYLKDLGVKIIWLSPIYPSPLDDLGYDISDYKNVHPDYGTLEDMDNLIKEADKRGLKIVMDLVVNHTSDEHPWFKESKKEGSPYRDYYYWRKGRKNNTLPPNNWTAMFPGPAWEYVPEVGLWYLHLYSKKQVDLDWHNPKVYDEVVSILKFWLDKGIYGFRCDVIDQIYKESLEDGKGHSPTARGIEHYLCTDGNHEILRRLHDDVFSHYDCVVIGETFDVDYPNGVRFLDKEMDMFFNFDHMGLDKPPLPFVIKKWHAKKFMKIIYGWQQNCTWNANYLENHDQLRSINRFGDPIHYWKESGSMLACLNLTLRGTPFIYEGEELGMLNLPKEELSQFKDVCCVAIYNIAKKFHLPNKMVLNFIDHYNRDHARSPVQWDDSLNAGFSTSKNGTWIPVNANYPRLNAELEAKDPGSILNYYKSLLALRNVTPLLQTGKIGILETKGNVFAYLRYQKDVKEKILVVLNFSNKPHRVSKQAKGVKGKILWSNYEEASFDSIKTLKPYEALIVSL